MNRIRKIATIVLLLMTALTMWANHPWLTRVYQYRPAPGQFVNTLPVARVGEPVDSVLARCQASICGRIDTVSSTFHGQIITRIDTVWAESMITLGGYGGYVVVGFDHPVVNMHTWDFEIMGNAFYSDQTSAGGSCEPGIVMVGVDADGDGVPSDGDKWYELAGSEYNHPTTQHDYAITYYRPDEGKPRTPSTTDPSLIDTTYIRWTSNDVNPDSTSGYMSRNSFHMQPYWPLWLQNEETLEFTGAKLRCNAEDIGARRLHAVFEQLLEDVCFNAGDENMLDFVKVYNAVNQYCGWIGETSTEVAGGIDFHPDAPMPAVNPADVNIDGEVNISDVNAVIDLILSGVTGATGDVNRDGEVNISDVNALIDWILQ